MTNDSDFSGNRPEDNGLNALATPRPPHCWKLADTSPQATSQTAMGLIEFKARMKPFDHHHLQVKIIKN
jgi:hypothetical protein